MLAMAMLPLRVLLAGAVAALRPGDYLSLCLAGWLAGRLTGWLCGSGGLRVDCAVQLSAHAADTCSDRSGHDNSSWRVDKLSWPCQ